MASLENMNDKVFNVSENIVMLVDDRNVGEMYVYDERHKYILNGASAKDLIVYFDNSGRRYLANEITNMVMNVDINMVTN